MFQFQTGAIRRLQHTRINGPQGRFNSKLVRLEVHEEVTPNWCD